MTLREYSSTSRTVDLFIDPNNEDGDIFTLDDLRQIVAASAQYDDAAFVTVSCPEECEDNPGRYWIAGITVRETTQQPSRGHLKLGDNVTVAPRSNDWTANPTPAVYVDQIESVRVETDHEEVIRAYREQKDRKKRTCAICGRVGTQRYVQTAAGWQCSPTAKACLGNRANPSGNMPENIPAPAPEFVTSPVESDHAKPTPALTTSHVFSTGVTAKCCDCTRTFSVTGGALIAAVDHHETNSGHVVTVYEQAAS